MTLAEKLEGAVDGHLVSALARERAAAQPGHPRPLGRLCERNFRELKAFAAEKKLPIGFNVESVSIRKAEIDAATTLFHALRAEG